MASVSNSQSVPLVLNELVTLDPKTERTRNLCWKILCQVTGAAAIVSALALAAFAVIHSTPFMAIGIAIGTFCVVDLIKENIWDKSTVYAQKAAFNAGVIKHLDTDMELGQFKELSFLLEKLGINPAIETTQLLPLFARYCYLQERSEERIKIANELFDPADPNIEIELAIDKEPIKVRRQDYTMAQVDFTNKQDVAICKKLQIVQLYRAHSLEKAAIDKLSAAYILKIIQSPYEERPANAFFQETPFNWGDRLLAKNDPGADIFIQTPKKNYTAEEIINKDTEALSREIFELPRAPWF